MIAHRGRAAGILLACAFCAACGHPGETRPPLLNIAGPIGDLRVVQYGGDLVVDFTIPKLTTEDMVIRNAGTVDLRIGPGPSPFDLNQWAEGAQKVSINAPGTGAAHAVIPVGDWAGKKIVVGVRMVNRKGRPSAWSNVIPLEVVAPVPPPTAIVAQAAPQGVKIKWQSPEHAFRVFRREASEKEPALVGSPETPEYIDATAQYGKTYEYTVQALNGKAESVLAAPVSLTPVDTFPPAVPTGLTAAPGPGSIQLIWDRNADADLHGYRVYRATGAGKLERIAEFVDTPAYGDRQIEAGKTYRYAVSAIDQAGNESTMSAAVEVTAP